jgi:hypothetical protein
MIIRKLTYKLHLESTGGWNRHKIKQMAKGNQTLVSIDKCLTRTPDMRVQLLENV